MNIANQITPLFLTTALLGLLYTSHGQTEKKHFILSSTAYTYQKVQDDAVSPLRYSGSAITLQTGHRYESTKTLSQVRLSFSKGLLKASNNPDHSSSQMDLIGARISWTYLRKVKTWKEENLRLFLGAEWDNLAFWRQHNRYNNSAQNYDGISALGISGTLQYDFELWKRPFSLEYQASLPLLAYVIRPAYTTPFLDGSFGSREFASLNEFFMLNAELKLSYPLKNGNVLSLSYQWNAYTYTHLNEVQSATHTISLSSFFKL